MKTRLYVIALALAVCALLRQPPTWASETVHAGPYVVTLSCDPPVIPVGSAKLTVRLATQSGAPVEGATVRVLAQMPTMPMGEQIEPAEPVPGTPGEYTAPARFGMAGTYVATVHVSAAAGAVTARVRLRTGENLAPGRATAAPAWIWIVVVAAAAVLALGLYLRSARPLRALRRVPLGTVLGALVLVGVAVVCAWIVRRYQQPGHMSIIESQAMDMSAMKAPVGSAPVAAMLVARVDISAARRYSGSVEPYEEDVITPRVTGIIVSMSLYPGDAVARGQVVAQLDTSELASRVATARAAVTMAQHEEMIAAIQVRQARAQARAAEAQVAQARSTLAADGAVLQGAGQAVAAAQADRSSAEDALTGAVTRVVDRRAALAAARANAAYWAEQIKRSAALEKSGSISVEEYQQDQASQASAQAAVRQAQAGLAAAQSDASAANAGIRKAEAGINGAIASQQAAASRVQADRAAVAQQQQSAKAMEAAADASTHEIPHTRAGIQEAQSRLRTAEVIQGYTQITAMTSGVVTARIASPGQLVQPGQPILRIANIQPVRVQASVPEEDLSSIRVGDAVRVWKTNPLQAASARVTSIFPSSDPLAHTSLVEALLPNQQSRFLPGQYVTVEIRTGPPSSSLVVPDSAIVRQAQATSRVLADASSTSVWVMRSGVAQRTVYTCTMHPQVQQDHPGRCPI